MDFLLHFKLMSHSFGPPDSLVRLQDQCHFHQNKDEETKSQREAWTALGGWQNEIRIQSLIQGHGYQPSSLNPVF